MLYLYQGSDHSIVLSSVHPDDPDHESNKVELMDEHYARQPGTYPGTRNMVTNILRAAGVKFEEL